MKNIILLFCAAALTLFSNTMQTEPADSMILFEERPYNLQLYARNQNDSAYVAISGRVIQTSFDSIKITVQQNDDAWYLTSEFLSYSDNEASFNFSVPIYAGLFEYSFGIDLLADTGWVSVLQTDSVVCGDVYILSGQSNSHYAWADAVFQNEYCRTYGVKTESSNYYPYNPADTLWSLSQASSALGPNVGVPGLYIQKMILEEYGIPTCMINGGTGGSIIEEHLRSSQDPMDLNTIYGKILYRIRKADIDRVRAIIWHQGENDADGAHTNAYPQRFHQLYSSWTEDFSPEKFYLFQIRPGCGGTTQGRFREMQRTLPDSLTLDNLSLMSTVGLSGYDGCHYSHAGYINMARWIYNLIRTDIYGSTDTINISAPNISSAFYERGKKRIVLVFDNTGSLHWPADTLGYSLKDYFYFDGDYGVIESAATVHDTLFLNLRGYNFFDHITYLPDITYNSQSATYQGPWLKNSRGIGALSFYNFPNDNPDTLVRLISPNGGEIWKPLTDNAIRWLSSNIELIDIEYSADNGYNWIPIADNIEAGIDSFVWMTPEIDSTQCKIRIYDSRDNTIADESNLPFGIYAKKMSVVVPNGGEKWTAGSVQTIRWATSFVNNMRIEYTIDNGSTWKTVRRFISTEGGEVEWPVPDVVSDSCKIKLIDAEETTFTVMSDSVFAIVSPAGIKDNDFTRSPEFDLGQNYPNPFNPVTTISFSLPVLTSITINIYDINGAEVRTLLQNKTYNPGSHTVLWDGRNNSGRVVSGGIYFYVLNAGDFTATKKMIILR